MSNIITYLRTQQHTFDEVPFNDVDSLILSTLSYFDYELVEFADCSGAEPVKLHDILALSERRTLVKGNWLQDTEESVEFWMALQASRRYREVMIGFYVVEFSGVIEKQFSAVCIFLPNETCYLSFRGTDGSFAGWKEDFNLCFKKTIPSQPSACRYLSGIASATKGSLMLGGHSKGGNLAEYAAATADNQVYERIIAVYNHDGPSFMEDPSPRIKTDQYRDMLHKTVPESSAFGMIMERRSDYRVVRSTANFVFQHQPFTWVVKDNDFVYQNGLNKGAVFFDSAVNEWLDSHTSEERERAIDTVFDLLTSVEADSWPEYATEMRANTTKVLAQSTRLDPETRKFLFSIVSSLAGILKDKTITEVLPAPPKIRFPRRNAYKKPEE